MQGGYGSLIEVQRDFTMRDVLNCIEAMDVRAECDQIIAKYTIKKNKPKKTM